MGKKDKHRKQTEAQAFLNESSKDDSKASDLSESEGEKDAAGEAAGEAGPETSPTESDKPEVVKEEPAMKEAVKADALSPEIPGKYRKFVK